MCVELLDERTVVSCTVSLKLGDSRDVVQAWRDIKKYRNGGAQKPEGEQPRYRLENGALVVDYPRGGSADSPIFFNLKGHGVGNIEDHNLTICAGSFWDQNQLCPVSGTPMDFRTEMPIGERIRMGYVPLTAKKGYDHCFLLRQERDVGEAVYEGLPLAAVLLDRKRTLQMNVYTSYPALWLDTANVTSGRDIGKGGCIYPKRGGIALMPCDRPDEKREGGGTVVYQFIPREIVL